MLQGLKGSVPGSAKDPPWDTGAGGETGEQAWIDVIQKMDQVYTDLVQSQTQLEMQNARLEEAQAFIGSVLSAMTDVLIVSDLQGRIQQVNRALEMLTGLAANKLVGRPLNELFHSSTFDPVVKFLEKVRLKEHLADCEITLASADGQGAPLAVNCTPRHDHKGRLVGFVIVGRPVGELRRAYRELDDAHQRLTRTQAQLVVSEKMAALGRLVAGVAHELNNPISFVFGNMHALKRYGTAIKRYLDACDRLIRAPEPELQRLRRELKIDHVLADITPLVEGTLEGAERVSDIVQDLRRFSSNQEEPTELFDLSRLVRTAADWVVKAERVKPTIEFDLAEPFEIASRRGAIHQILVNLVQNAVDVLAGRSDARIRISGETDGRLVAIAVADNGTGIKPEHFDKIFEPFFTTKPIGRGTGLGLYISYGMALKLGGNLTAANNADGGATFILTVPVNDSL
ncbi:MAG: PAS domain S-box protein [Hyphomicrobiaceae bacterium]|nr:PAS domain S-box protein [Hyphomicrobiaceae bacterium]